MENFWAARQLRSWACRVTLAATVVTVASQAAAQEQIFFPAHDNYEAQLVAKINAENVRLDIAVWLLNDGSITTALINRWNAGIPVRVLGDRAGIFESDPNTRASFERLANAGIPIRLRYNPTWFPEIMHWKYGGFTGQGYASIGSGNWTSFELAPVSGTNFKDEAEMLTNDPLVVRALRTKFDQFWVDTTYFLDWPDAYQRETGIAWTTPMKIQRLRLEPDYPTDALVWGQGPEIINRMISEINAENTAIDVVSYRLTVPSLTDALIARKQAGVPVRVFIEPTQYRSDKYPEYWLVGNEADRLWVAGIPIKIRVHDGLTHMKTLITARTALLASSNYTKYWQRDHNYFIQAASKPTLYMQMKNEFNRMWKDTVKYTNFYPLKPQPVALVSPGSGAINVSTLPTLQWNRAPWAVAFDVYLGTSPSNMTKIARVGAVLNEDPPQTYSYTLSQALQPSTTYYWKVVSRTFATDVDPTLIASTTVAAFTTTAGPSPSPTVASRKGDFSNDLRADIVWQRDDGYLAIWAMNGASAMSTGMVNPASVDPNWRIAATADINGDGKADFVWQHANGWLAVWYMNGPNLAGSELLNPAQVADPNWKIVGTGDFNGDGKADLVWQHKDGGLALWYLSGPNLVGSALLNPAQVADPNWKIVGTGDFNGDGKADLVWQHKDGRLAVWYMSGANLAGSALLNPAQVGDQNWRIRAVIDLNGDGQTDLIWQNMAEGWLTAWFMKGVTAVNGVYLNPSNVSGGWKIVGPR